MIMRRPLIAGNWKMNKTIVEAVDIVSAMVTDLSKVMTVDSVICPPFLALTKVKDTITNNNPTNLTGYYTDLDKGGVYTRNGENFSQINDKIVFGISQFQANSYEPYYTKASKEQAQLKAQLDAGLITEEEYAKAKAALDEKYAAEERRIKRKAAETAKAFAIFEAIVNTAAGVAKAIPNIPLMILAGVIGALQIAAIATQPLPALAEGGIANRATQAQIGEAGPEAVLPLTPEVLGRIGEGMAQGMITAQLSTSGGSDQPIIMMLDGEILGTVIGRRIANKQILIDHRNLVNT